MKKIVLLSVTIVTLSFIFLGCISFDPVAVNPKEDYVYVDQSKEVLFSATKTYLKQYKNAEANLFQATRNPDLTIIEVDEAQQTIVASVDLGEYYLDQDLLFNVNVSLHAVADIVFTFKDGTAKAYTQGINTVVNECKKNCNYEDSEGIDRPYVKQVKEDFLHDFIINYSLYLDKI